jgi:hypothetical protein
MSITRKQFDYQKRRETCLHESAHAIVETLLGGHVHVVEVAPENSVIWTPISRISAGSAVGFSYVLNTISKRFLSWDSEKLAFSVNRRCFDDYVLICELSDPNFKSFINKRIRREVIACLAGPTFDYMLSNGDYPEYEWWFDIPDYYEDVSAARSLSSLLSNADEYSYLLNKTFRYLRNPKVWDYIVQMAEKLEETGILWHDEIISMLPAKRSHWPRMNFNGR